MESTIIEKEEKVAAKTSGDKSSQREGSWSRI